MAQIIRKFAKGDKVKKFETPAEKIEKEEEKIDLSANAFGLSSNKNGSNPINIDLSSNALGGNPSTENKDGSIDLSASAFGIKSPEFTKPTPIKYYVNNDEKTIDVDKLIVDIGNRIAANKQLNQKEAVLALERFEKLLKSAKGSVRFTNKGFYLDNENLGGIRDFRAGFDGLLLANQADDYIKNIALRLTGAIPATETTNGTSGSFSTTRRSKFDLPIVNLQKSPNPKDEIEKSEEQLAIDAFNEEHKTSGSPTKYTFDGIDIYRFDLGNGNYVLAKKNADGSYNRIIDDSHYVFGDYNDSNFGNIFTPVNDVYRLINEQNSGDQTKEYQSVFTNILNEIKKTVGINYNARSDFYHQPSKYYNEHLENFEGVPVDVLDHFIPDTGNVKSMYIDSNTPKTHFGRYDLDKIKNGRLVVIENGKPTVKDVTFDNDGVNLIAKIGDQTIAKFAKSNFPEYESNWVDNNYQPLDIKAFSEDLADIHDNDIQSKTWFWDARFELPGSNNDDYDEYETYINLPNVEEQLLNGLDQFLTEVKNTSASKYGDDYLKTIYNSLYKQVVTYGESEKGKTNPYMYSKMANILQQIQNELVKKDTPPKQVPSNKKGGSIFKYESGSFMRWVESNKNAKVSEYDNEDDVYQPTPQGTVGRSNAKFTNIGEWSGTDVARGVATAANAAALAGGVVGLSAGLAGTAVELGADIADYRAGKISGSDLALNVAMNLGFTILSIIPGMASAKIAKTAVKGGAKVAKSLKKVENIGKLIDQGADSAKAMKAAETLGNVSTTIKPKDVDNILDAAEELFSALSKNPNAAREAGQLEDLIKQCKAIKRSSDIGTSTEVIAKMAPAINAGMTALGLTYGASETLDTAGKIFSGDMEDISLQNIQGILAGIGGIRGGKQLFRNYALKRGLTDIDTPTNNTTGSELKEIPLEINGKQIKVKANSDRKVDVKSALKQDVENFEAQHTKLKEQLQVRTSESEKATLAKKINKLESEIKARKEILEDFNEFYKEPSKVKNWVKNQANSIKDSYNGFTNKFKSYDYRNKKLIEDSDDLSWIQRKGREFAIREGFTEDGFNPYRNPALRGEKHILNIRNSDKKKWAKENLENSENVKNVESKDIKLLPDRKRNIKKAELRDKANLDSSGEIIKPTPLKHRLSLPEPTKRQRKEFEAKAKRTLNSSGEIIITEDRNSLTAQSIKKVLKLKDEVKDFSKLKDLKRILNQIKSESKVLTDQDRLDIMNSVFSNPKFKALKPVNKQDLENLLLSLKKGGKVKSYQNSGVIGDASTSAKDLTKDEDYEKNGGNKGKGSETEYTPYPLRTQETLMADIAKPNWGGMRVALEPIQIMANSIDSLVTAEKAYKTLAEKPAVKKQYAEMHLPVVQNLAKAQDVKNTIQEGSAKLNRNQVSDSIVQKAMELEYAKQSTNAINKYNAEEEDNLNNQRFKSIGQEFVNATNRVDTANYNNNIDGELATYLGGLIAQKDIMQNQIRNATRDQLGQFLNKYFNAEWGLDTAKKRNQLLDQYYSDIEYDSKYLNDNESYETSTVKPYESVLGINKDTIVTQDIVDKAYENWATQNPNATKDDQNEFKEILAGFIGKTLSQYYTDAYKEHEVNLEKINRIFQANSNLLGWQQNVNSHFIPPVNFKGYPYKLKKGGSFAETKYKTDAKSKDIHKKLALEYAKLMHKQHQETLKNSLPFLLHSYKNTIK